MFNQSIFSGDILAVFNQTIFSGDIKAVFNQTIFSGDIRAVFNQTIFSGDILAVFNQTIFSGVTWKRLNTETPQRGNVSKKRTHKTNLMSSSLNFKIKRLYSTDFHIHGHSTRPPSLF